MLLCLRGQGTPRFIEFRENLAILVIGAQVRVPAPPTYPWFEHERLRANQPRPLESPPHAGCGATCVNFNTITRGRTTLRCTLEIYRFRHLYSVSAGDMQIGFSRKCGIRQPSQSLTGRCQWAARPTAVRRIEPPLGVANASHRRIVFKSSVKLFLSNSLVTGVLGRQFGAIVRHTPAGTPSHV